MNEFSISIFFFISSMTNNYFNEYISIWFFDVKWCSDFLIIGNYPTSPYSLHFYKITFKNTVVNAASKMSCPSGSWSTFYSESLMSSDKSKIYSCFTFGPGFLNLFFITFNSTDLSVIGSIYKASISWTMIYGSALVGNYIIISAIFSNNNMLVFDISTSSFSVYKFAVSNMYVAAVEPNTNK